jgi:hypothetical protein
MRNHPVLSYLRFLVLPLAFIGGVVSHAQSANKAPAAAAHKSQGKPVDVVKKDPALIPSAFAGWEAASAAQPIVNAGQADPANTAALKEYGFTDGIENSYARDGETLQIKAFRFVDASGAYGAYTFYRHNNWPKVDIGTGATSDNNRVLFWLGNVFIDANFSRISAMSASELRELAATLPKPAGNKSLAPPLLENLPYKPQMNPDGQTLHYALGPAGYVGPDAKEPLGVLPPDLVGFDRGAETVTASYKLSSGPAILTLINYPTPQMATAQARTISEFLKAGNSPQHPFSKLLQDSNPAALEVRRSGPLVVVVSGDPIEDEAHKLASAVHYEANTSNLPGMAVNPVQQTAKLIVGIITLVVVMFIAAIGVALFLGGGRAGYRILRGRPISSVYDEEFTKLDLK